VNCHPHALRTTPPYSGASLRASQNAKIRDGILDVKGLQQVDVNGLELWEPVLKAKFRSVKMMLLRLSSNGSCHFPDLAEKPTRSTNSLIN
jgi:hypothetical protein